MNRKPITRNKLTKLADKMSMPMRAFFDVGTIDESVGYGKDDRCFYFWRDTGHQVRVAKMKSGMYIVTSQSEEPDPEYLWMGVDDEDD